LCADTISTYLEKKSERGGPTVARPFAEKVCMVHLLHVIESYIPLMFTFLQVYDCVYASHEKIKSHKECHPIMESFRACLAKGKRVPCQPIKAALEECTVRNFRDELQ
jgi:hypothetical protein